VRDATLETSRGKSVRKNFSYHKTIIADGCLIAQPRVQQTQSELELG